MARALQSVLCPLISYPISIDAPHKINKCEPKDDIDKWIYIELNQPKQKFHEMAY